MMRSKAGGNEVLSNFGRETNGEDVTMRVDEDFGRRVGGTSHSGGRAGVES